MASRKKLLVVAGDNYGSSRSSTSTAYQRLYTNGGTADRTQNPESSLNRAQAEQTENLADAAKTKKLLFGIKAVIGFIFMVIVLGSSVLSKLTLVSLADHLRSVTYFPNASKRDVTGQDLTTAVTIYWYLQFVLLIPNFITFIRCMASGVIGKTTRTFPWPKGRAIALGIAGSIVEVVVMTTLVYLVLPEISPGAGILLLCGVFFFQIMVDIYHTQNWIWCQNDGCCCARSERRGFSRLRRRSKVEYVVCFVQLILENRMMKIIALLFQTVGIFGFIGIWVSNMKHRGYNMIQPMIGYLLGILLLSVIWSTWFQEKIAAPHRQRESQSNTARFKSCFINSGVRLFLYPLVSYFVFRYISEHGIDPWCLHNSTCHIILRSDDLPIMIVQVVFTFFGYIIGWVACTMTLSRLSLALPLLLSTPITVLWYYLSTYSFKLENRAFPNFTIDEENLIGKVDKYIPILTSLLWLSELIAMGYFLLVKTNIILSRDQEMFLTPHYDGVFFEQYMILNRQTKKKCVYDGLSQEDGRGERIRRNPRTIFICSTMYRENETEMKQMLSSIYNLARQYHAKKRYAGEGGTHDKYESHIFFDGAINDTQIQEFGLQLLSLLEETLHIKLQQCKREKTPYGYRLSWFIGLGDMPFTVHFKDKALVKPKKRWSQVMYMNYVLKHRIMSEGLNASDTFILTTDADIDFTPQSADVLLDMLACNEQVGAVCARTHPKGSGPVYWYQIFDYAIGHWFQKPAEHILGCVLCSPGCFSVFRCSALEGVLDTYSTEVVGAYEFLMKDMGEDRWLCTLLIKAGWRLEYCAISEDQTYCPTEFGEFFKQRRRWIPSTIANLAQLISEAGSITRKNDTVSILFILFQAIMVFSTAISPATVILVISSGLQSAFHLTLSHTLMIISALVIVSVFYGMVCLLSSPQTQLDMAKLLTFIFTIIMAVVIVGIFKDTIYSIFHGHQQVVLNPPSCNSTSSNKSADAAAVETCEKAANYIRELAKSLWKPDFILPVSTSTLYLGAFAVTFLVAAVLHLPEWYCLLHCVWYLLALPSGYLLLLIYSAANLDSQSWGTREGSSGKDKGLLGWLDHLKSWFKKCVACCIWCYQRGATEKETTPDKAPQPEEVQGIRVIPSAHSQSPSCQEETDSFLGEWDEDLEMTEEEHEPSEEEHELLEGEYERLEEIRIRMEERSKRLEEEHKQLQKELKRSEEREQLKEACKRLEEECKQLEEEHKQLEEEDKQIIRRLKKERWNETVTWLKDKQKCPEEYADNFKKHGYVNLHLIAAMKPEDFEAIGINKRGFRLRLQKAAKRLPSLPIYTDVPKNVRVWLRRLQLPEYTEMFEREGYSTGEDLESLKDLKESDLTAMGISKRAHLQRLKTGINNLVKPTALDRRIRATATIIENLPATDLSSTNADEAEFWIKLIDVKLKPVSVRFQGQIEDLKQSLRSLRNQMLAMLFLVNIMWILLLYTLNFPELEDYGLDSRGFQLLFLAVYGFIIVVQFITLLCHRLVTLVHYLGRTQPNEVIGSTNHAVDMDPLIVESCEIASLHNQSA